MDDSRARKRSWIRGAALFAFGVALVVLVFRAIGANVHELVGRARFSAPYAALAVVMTVLSNGVVAYRWKLLSEHRGEVHLPLTNYFRVTMMARLLGQFSSNLFMDVVGRSTGLRWQGDSRSLGRRLATLLLERGLDVLLLCLMLGWAIAARTASASFAVVSFVAVCALSFPLSGPFLGVSQRLLGFAGALYLRLRNKAGSFDAQSAGVAPELVRTIAFLGVLRYVLVVGQYWAMGATIGVVLPAFFITGAAPLAQLSTVVAFTPGSLGIQEAGWAGALSWLGLDKTSTALFVVGQRVLLVVLFAVVTLIAEALYRFQRSRTRSAV